MFNIGMMLEREQYWFDNLRSYVTNNNNKTWTYSAVCGGTAVVSVDSLVLRANVRAAIIV